MKNFNFTKDVLVCDINGFSMSYDFIGKKVPEITYTAPGSRKPLLPERNYVWEIVGQCLVGTEVFLHIKCGKEQRQVKLYKELWGYEYTFFPELPMDVLYESGTNTSKVYFCGILNKPNNIKTVSDWVRNGEHDEVFAYVGKVDCIGVCDEEHKEDVASDIDKSYDYCTVLKKLSWDEIHDKKYFGLLCDFRNIEKEDYDKQDCFLHLVNSVTGDYIIIGIYNIK